MRTETPISKWFRGTAGSEQSRPDGLPPNEVSSTVSLMQHGRAFIRLLKCDLRDTDSGATTVEFAMVGSTFCMLFLLAALFSVYYLRVTILDLTVQKVSRQLLLNQTLTQSQFAAAVQSGSFGMLSGQTINVAVQSASSFGAITPVANINGGGTLPYNTGSTGSDVLVQVGYTDSSLGLFLPNFLT